jgi:tRNA ligase
VSHELSSVTEVRAFTEEVGRTGKWNGEALEGFVVRTTVRRPPTNGAHADASPYAPGSSFFFKIKFDEPYMMYRDWREITKSLLSRGEKCETPEGQDEAPRDKDVRRVGEERDQVQSEALRGLHEGARDYRFARTIS